jgi:hypothetical protein
MPSIDPDLPILWDTLERLRAAVAAGGITQDAASEILGKVADDLVVKRRASEVARAKR